MKRLKLNLLILVAKLLSVKLISARSEIRYIGSIKGWNEYEPTGHFELVFRTKEEPLNPSPSDSVLPDFIVP